ncbi:prolyl oligopeptidase family serine peptidase [Lentisphaera marina]|uniref:GDSL-type esterase/lipase family protein n=1 Tax=Lentisphaera marina TaxID=1111041 RepID=UPI0023655C97|nr:GDSL-type esterase/lipase family protein [Lentisphaera marina]MDD7983992.1 prolyl oligopeptidase family serine peptidase [Lentisphaera marina]
MQAYRITIFSAILLFLSSFTLSANTQSFPGKASDWHGYTMYSHQGTKIVVPKKIADGKPWVWRARFWGHEPQFDLAMLQRGYHVVYCDVSNWFGSPKALKKWDDFYNYLRFEHLFADRAILEGMSRGGLIIYNWAAKNPDKVAAIYGDAPVMDFKSWPGGKGSGPGSPGAWKACLKAYGFSEEQALAYKSNPIDNLQALAKAKIPILHVVGDVDKVVPVSENTAIAQQRYKQLGGIFEVIHKKDVGHHPHSLKDPKAIVDFMIKHTEKKTSIAAEDIVGDKNFISRSNFQNSRITFERNKKGHVAFLGGSITEMNGYRPMMMTYLQERFPETKFKFTDAGISSTCSDTGAFRLQRDILSQGPLDMLFVEFAVNDDQDGVYNYNDAIRGMEGIVAQARRHNLNVDIIMTFFVNQNILQLAQKGEMNPSTSAHNKVAKHYSISVNNLAQELADLINAKKMTWKKFGGVHPNKYGNTMAASMIQQALEKQWSKPLAKDAKITAHQQKELLDPKSYSKGRFLVYEDIEIDQHWKKGAPNWKQENKGNVRTRFQKSPMIYTKTAGAKLKIQFTGTAIGAYMLSGPDAGIIKCTIDGKETKIIDTLHKHSGFNYPMTLMFFNELSDGEHTLELETLPNKKGRIKPGGSAFRALYFTAN